jgi:tetratricopeptide (TPR) repeat protein
MPEGLQRRLAAIAAIDVAVARQPNDADVHVYRGLTLAFAGRPDDGIEPAERALRLNPRFVRGPYLNIPGCILFLEGNHDGAVRSFEENLARHGPVGPQVLCWTAAAYGPLDRRTDAAHQVDLQVSRFPAFRLDNWNFFKLLHSPEERQRVHDLMVAAGVPE